MTSPPRTADAEPVRLADLLETLRDWPWFETLRTLRQRFGEDRLGLTAGSLTFTTLITLVPLFTVALALFTAFPVFGQFRGALETYFLKALVPAEIAKPVLGALTTFAGKARGIGSAGLLFLTLTALATMLTIDRALNAIWRVRRPRPVAQRILVYWAALTLGPLVLAVSLSATSYAFTASRGLVGALPGGVSALIWLLQVGLLALAMAALFHYVPNTWVRWRHALAGGVFVALGFQAAKTGLAYYVSAVPALSAVYGTFVTLPLLLLWIYLSWVIVLLGAVIAAYAPSLRMRVARWPSTPGHRFELALAVLRQLAATRGEPPHGLSLGSLAARLRVDPLQIEPVVEQLQSLDWVQRLEEEGGARWVLLADPALAPAAPLVAQMLLRQSDLTRSVWRAAGIERLRLADLLASGG
jgi:membrane protein